MPQQQIAFARGDDEISVHYRALRDGSFRLGDGGEARVHAWSPDAIDVEIDRRRFRARVTRAGDRLIVHEPRGDVELVVLPRFEVPGSEDAAGGFVARMPGKVIELRVKVGDSVRAGETLLVLEAMKMEHPMRATDDGVVSEVRVALGDQVESGALLLVVEPTEGNDGEAKGDS
jgi:propionyl-CoA carboxylase alpha chain